MGGRGLSSRREEIQGWFTVRGIDGAACGGEKGGMRLSRTMTSSMTTLKSLLLACLAACGLSGCAGTRENLDTMWNTIDPAGHHRYHKDKYYPHERRTGIKLPKGVEG